MQGGASLPVVAGGPRKRKDQYSRSPVTHNVTAVGEYYFKTSQYIPVKFQWADAHKDAFWKFKAPDIEKSKEKKWWPKSIYDG